MIFTLIKYIPLVILGLILVVGCSDSKERLKGERTRLLEVTPQLQADPDAQNINVELTSPINVVEWTQMDTNPRHIKPHALMATNEWEPYWKKSIGASSSDSGYILATPVIKNDIIYTLDGQGTIMALNALTGDKLWSYRMESAPQGCLGGGMAIDNERLYVSFSSADIIALDAIKGTKLWQKNILHPIRSSVTVKDNQLYIVTKNNKVISLDATNGHILWHREASEGACSFLGGGAVAVDRRIAIVPFSSGEVMALQSENGHPLWTQALTSQTATRSLAFLSQIKASPVIDREMVFVTSPNGRFMALDFKTGAVIWDKTFGSLNTPVVNDKYIFLITTKNEVVCLTRDTGIIVWIQRLPRFKDPISKKDPIKLSGPLLANNRLLVTSSIGEAYVIEAITGQLSYSYASGYPSLLPAIVANKIIYILTDTGTLVALR